MTVYLAGGQKISKSLCIGQYNYMKFTPGESKLFM